MGLAEDIGRDIYREAGLDPLTPPEGGAADLAVRIYNRGIIYTQPRAMAEAALAKIGGRRCIVLRRGLSPQRANFRVAEMLARLRLEELPWYRIAPAPSLLADVAAWIVAPTEPFRACMAQVGVDLAALSETFAITWTCAAMRIPEIGGPDAVVTTPDVVHRRGRMLRWMADDDVRRLAALRAPKSVRKVVVRDEPGRVALLARAG